MALENATYINTLVPTNPTDVDNAGQGAAQIRLVKQVLQSTFPDITGPLNVTQDQINSLHAALIGSGAAVSTTPSGSLTVGTGGINTTGGLGVAGNASVTGVLTATAGLTTNGSVAANGNISASGTLSVGGALSAGSIRQGGLTLIPSGCIMLWVGGPTNIPAGWLICDGNNGTPNLEDVIVIGGGKSLANQQIPGSVAMQAVNGATGAPWNLYTLCYIMKE